MLPTTSDRVQQHTRPEVNERLAAEARENVRLYSGAPVELIERRLAELDREWDIERALEANAAVITATSTLLGLTWKRGFLLMPLVVGGFLLQHALQGWCPPLAIFRARGVRTHDEIEAERQALKALRGDYQALEPRAQCQSVEDSEAYLQAARK